jgi:predicted O-methyltransferase YrrM
MTATSESLPLYDGDFCAFSDSDREALRALIRAHLRPNARFVEIGSWLGNGSTQVLLEEISVVEGVRLLCVDTWTGNPGVTRHSEIVDHYDVLGTFRRNTAFSNHLDIMVASSLSAAAIVADKTFDLIFLDADHRYCAVKADIEAWLPKVKPGGTLCGHDCECRVTPTIIEAVQQHPDADTVAIDNPHFSAIHAGCVLAVHEAFDGAAALMNQTHLSSIWHHRITQSVFYRLVFFI